MGRMGCSPGMDRTSSLLGTEVWRPIDTRPILTVPVPLLDALTASFGNRCCVSRPPPVEEKESKQAAAGCNRVME
jgi:hypothetical protein